MSISRVRLLASDGQGFDTTMQVAEFSGTIKEMIEHCKPDSKVPGEVVIPLANVRAPILQMVLKFIEYHKDDPAEPTEPPEPPVRTNTDLNLCDAPDTSLHPWDVEFLTIDQPTLFELMNAANYLNVEKLLTVTCKTVANMIKGKNPREICDTFNMRRPAHLISNDD